MDGINAMPASEGPQVPSKAWPTKDPTNPAQILEIHPIELPFFVIAPAINPINAPTINDQIISHLFLKIIIFFLL